MTTHTLHEMLTFKRPHGSKGEAQFIDRFLAPLGVKADGYGNLHKRVGNSPNIMWSSHTDTVHATDGPQKIEVTTDGWIFAANSDCLGADCTAGVWIMAEMIKRKMPGHYVFHRAEECGGKGSSWIAANMRKQLAKLDAAVAFDRKGFTSVITHQWNGRTCSDAFAQSLAKQVSPKWKADDTGTFTDTANYTDLIGECTNVSVGYLDQHSSKEAQFVPYLEWLLDTMCRVDQRALTFSRKPGEIDPDDWHSRYYSGAGSAGDYEDLVLAIERDPTAAAAILHRLGYTAEDILDEVYNDTYGAREAA